MDKVAKKANIEFEAWSVVSHDSRHKHLEDTSDLLKYLVLLNRDQAVFF